MTAQTRGEIDVLEDHLRNMRIKGGQLVCPPALEDFELFFSRRSVRRTYQYTSENVPCHLDVCKEESQEGPTENGEPLEQASPRMQLMQALLTVMRAKCTITGLTISSLSECFKETEQKK